MTGSPASLAATARSGSKIAFPTAAPGDAFRPLPSNRSATLAFADSSNRGSRSWTICAGSTRWIASSFVMTPSLTMSTAIFTAAGAVRFPERVCSM